METLETCIEKIEVHSFKDNDILVIKTENLLTDTQRENIKNNMKVVLDKVAKNVQVFIIEHGPIEFEVLRNDNG